MSRSFLMAALVAVFAVLVGASQADAQVLKKIRERTKAKVAEKVEKTEERMLDATGEVVDSVAEKSARGADTVVTRSGDALTGAVDRTEEAVTSVFRRGGSRSELARALEAGHVVLDDLAFEPDGALSASSLGTVRALARALAETADVWVVEGHLAPGAGADERSESRAKAVKAALVEAGVAPSRVWARGFGASRPPTGSSTAAERIELVRMQ